MVFIPDLFTIFLPFYRLFFVNDALNEVKVGKESVNMCFHSFSMGADICDIALWLGSCIRRDRTGKDGTKRRDENLRTQAKASDIK